MNLMQERKVYFMHEETTNCIEIMSHVHVIPAYL